MNFFTLCHRSRYRSTSLHDEAVCEEKARRKGERRELKARQAKKLHNFDNTTLVNLEKEESGAKH
jgi:hypothetical protein